MGWLRVSTDPTGEARSAKTSHKPTLLFLLKYTVKGIFVKVHEMRPHMKKAYLIITWSIAKVLNSFSVIKNSP